MQIPKNKKSDHLFLLMGENPLPNYVAAMLLPLTESSKVYLVHSEGEKQEEKTVLSTQQFAEFLKTALISQKQDLKICLHGVNEVNSAEIRSRVREIIDCHKIAGRVGLNYTGARKPMAVHTYLELQKHESEFEQLVFSYLDANRLAMFFDGLSSPYPVAKELEVKLETLAALHGYELKNIERTPKSLKLARMVRDIHLTDDGIKEWRDWICQTCCETLPDRNTYPALASARDAFDEMFGGQATPELVAQELGFPELKSGSNWFTGGWLEDFALEAILNNKNQYQIKIHDYGISLKPVPLKSLELKNPKNFELDVAAMIGYQLLAVSCIASKKQGGETKKHLFEAYVRARQLGGDEARVALVCLAENPSVLQDEISRDWHPNHQIKVFGKEDIKNLTAAFYDWFATTN